MKTPIVTVTWRVGTPVTWWQYAGWGAFGGLAVELLEFHGAIRRTGGWPWRQKDEPGPGPLLVSVVIRLIVGAGLAWALGAAQQVSGPAGALMVGVAAPLIFEQMARQFQTPSVAPVRGDKTS